MNFMTIRRTAEAMARQASVLFRILGLACALTLGPAAPAAGVELMVGLVLLVDSSDMVTVKPDHGVTRFPGPVGDCPSGMATCSYLYLNGWGHVSGTVEWRDTNAKLTLRLDGSGVDVLNPGGVANDSGSASKIGHANLTGDATLGSALRAAAGSLTDDFTSVVATNTEEEPDLDYEVSGCVMFAPPDLTAVSPIVSDTAVTPGQLFDLSVSVQNVPAGGATTVGKPCENTTLTFYRSDVFGITTFDTEIASQTLPPVPAFAARQETATVSIDMEEDYWLGACIEPLWGEVNATNQCSAGVRVIVGPPCETVTVSNQNVSTMTTFQACGTLVAGSNLTVTTSLGASFVSGDTVTLDNGFDIGLGAEAQIGVCGQDLCVASASPLDSACHPCVETVCLEDPTCCTSAWDDDCRELVQTECELVCP